jgi:hypothetical protein
MTRGRLRFAAVGLAGFFRVRTLFLLPCMAGACYCPHIEARTTSTNDTMTATFKAYQGSDRDNLIARLVELAGWSHIGQVRASDEMNHVEVDVFFSRDGQRLREKVRANTLLGAWKLQRIS